jgi:hypothetical protein
VRLAGVTLATAAEERHGPRLQAPALLGADIGVGVPAHAHVVVRLVDEQQRLLAAARVAVEVEERRSRHEQALGRGLHEGREVGERVGRAERAVGAVGREDVGHHGLDVVLRHGDGVPRQHLFDLDDVGDGQVCHGSVPLANRCATAR